MAMSLPPSLESPGLRFLAARCSFVKLPVTALGPGRRTGSQLSPTLSPLWAECELCPPEAWCLLICSLYLESCLPGRGRVVGDFSTALPLRRD